MPPNAFPPRLASRDAGYSSLEPDTPGPYATSPHRQSPPDPFSDPLSHGYAEEPLYGVDSGGAGGEWAQRGGGRPAEGVYGHFSGPVSPTASRSSILDPSARYPSSPNLSSSASSIHSSSHADSPRLGSPDLRRHAAAAAAVSSASPTAPHFAERAIPVYTDADAARDEKLHTLLEHERLTGGTGGGISFVGALNILALFAIAAGLVTLFGGWPIIQWATRLASGDLKTFGAFGLGGTNSSGMVPEIPNLPGAIDKDTPSDALTRTGFDGKKYVLTFSDEFNTPGRTFWPGDDPYWEAVDLHYWNTNDYEWYDPDALTTRDGNLEITLTQEPIHDLNFRSGMLQSWNKLCFTGGYMEVNLSLPGESTVGGLWPGVWTLANLGRAGHGATTDGMWPYSYDSCDIGTLPNQTSVDGTGPRAALTTGPDNGSLSFLPGQRVSACTCKGGDHPGPNVGVGRGVPEIDALEALIDIDPKTKKPRGRISQSAQFAPYDDSYNWAETSPHVKIYNSSKTEINGYKGGIYQQATSGLSVTDPRAYERSGAQYSTYGFEYDPTPSSGEAYITWTSDGAPDWTLYASAVGPNSNTQVGQRLISREPMSIVLNLGISDAFQTIDYANLEFPVVMKIDYVRIYQQEGRENMGCDPKDFPTAKYIEDHINAYTNPNLTTWDQAGYEFPKNSLVGC
ncbi:hypothetical protein JCM10207_006455 [Rhodosporidiobolus poonsookiae]